jgi:hypothetical protein
MIINKRITLDDTVTQDEGNIVCDMDGDKVMLNIENSKYYNLGDIGGDIWGLMENTVSVRQLVTRLMAEYDVDQTECEIKVISFLEQLYDEKLIRINT